MKIIPKKIHQIWLGGQMPELFINYQKTWIKHHPGWELIIWNENNLNNLKNIDFADLNKCNSFSEKSDYLRFCILMEYWWLYIDTDFECYRNVEPLLENEKIVIWEEFYWVFNAAFIGSTKNNEVIREIFLGLKEQLKVDTKLNRTGPIFISKYIKKYRNKIKIVPWGMLYPEYWLYIRNNKEETIYANHHYSASWCNNTTKNIIFLKRKLAKSYLWRWAVFVVHLLALKTREIIYKGKGYH